MENENVPIGERLIRSIDRATAACERLTEALEAIKNPNLELPCAECLKAEAEVTLPWDRARKVCVACWNEITDGAPIAEADRIHRIEKD